MPIILPAAVNYAQKDLFNDAALILQDRGFNRWTPDLMNVFLNAGINEIALNKPNAVEKYKTLALLPGTHQKLTAPDFALIRALNNYQGAAITDVSRETMDGMVPGWADEAIYPPSAIVQHVLYDIAEPSAFRVFPSNDGNGVIEAVVARIPDILPNGSAPSDVNTYTGIVGVSEIYRQALTDYVIAKCFTMDAIAPGNAARAQAHYAMFANAIGIKYRAEQIASPKTTNAAAASGG